MTVTMCAPVGARPCFECFQVADAAGGRGVAPVHERVDHDVLHTHVVRQVGQGDEVIEVAVHAAVADQSQEMQPPARCRRLRERLLDDGIRR